MAGQRFQPGCIRLLVLGQRVSIPDKNRVADRRLDEAGNAVFRSTQ